MTSKNCELCGSTEQVKTIFDYSICNVCSESLKLFTKKTISKHSKSYNSVADHKAEISNRIKELRIDFIKKDIRLKDILSKIE